jgi:hypothetical protein
MTISTVGPVRITCSIFRYAPTAPRCWRDCELSPKPGWTRAIGAVDLLGHDALGAKPTSVLEHRRTIPADVFVEQDGSLSIAQQPRQCCFAVEERAITQVLTIMLDQVECIEDRGTRGGAAAQLLEPRKAVRPQNNRLAIDREALGLDPPGSSRDGWQSHGPVIGVAGVKPDYGPIPADDQAVAVMLDFVNPIGARRRFLKL